MKKIILCFAMTIGTLSIANANNQELVNQTGKYICTIESDTDDGGCCKQVGYSEISMTDACKKALNEDCAIESVD